MVGFRGTNMKAVVFGVVGSRKTNMRIVVPYRYGMIAPYGIVGKPTF